MEIDDTVENVPGAYLIIDPENKKAYVGSTTELRRRGLRHERELKNGVHYNQELQQHYVAHNGNLLFIATELDDKEQALEFEQSIIDDLYGTTVLCNIAIDARDAGVGFQLTEEHKAKLVAANIGRPKSEEHRQAISQTLTGRKASPEKAEMLRTIRLGVKNTEEHNRKISEGNKGKVIPDEVRKKMSESGKRKVFTNEHKANMAKAQLGRKMSQEAVDKSNLAKLKPIQIDDVCYLGIKTAAEDLGMTSKMVTKRLDSDKYPNFKRIDKEDK